MSRQVLYVAGSTQKVCQLTGEFDRERGLPTPSQTRSRYGLVGTDLGASFEHKGAIYFLFGDSWPEYDNVHGNAKYRIGNEDSIGYTRAPDPGAGLRLDFVTAPDGWYQAPRVHDLSTNTFISNGAFEVPTGGFGHEDTMYVFRTVGHDPFPGIAMKESYLARSTDSGHTFTMLYNVSVDNFINIAPVVVDNSQIPYLPHSTGKGVLLWGSGSYRQSNPYLAYVPLDQIERLDAWRYFAGMRAEFSRPCWSHSETDASPLFWHSVIGEFSVSWNPYLEKWLMLYGVEGKPGGRPGAKPTDADVPSRIYFSTADLPWGPWSASAVLFDPWADHGYRHFLHDATPGADWDDLPDPSAPFPSPKNPQEFNDWGVPYAPYIVAPYTESLMDFDRHTTIYFVMSTWNPYNTVLMKSTLRLGPLFTDPSHIVGGVPSLIQARFGSTNNLELVVPLATGGLATSWRNNDLTVDSLRCLPWIAAVIFSKSVAAPVEAVSLIQSNLGKLGNRELVARVKDRLLFFWRDGQTWYGPVPLKADDVEVTGVTGTPALIQSRFGSNGNFELVVPLAVGGLAHYWRDNDQPDLPWYGPTCFGQRAGYIDDTALIQSSVDTPGNLEVIARAGERLLYFYRDDDGWHGPTAMEVDRVAVRGVSGNPSLIQSQFGLNGNLELVVPLAKGGLAHYWRSNDQPDLPWYGPNIIHPSFGRVDAVSLAESSFDGQRNLEMILRQGDWLSISWRDADGWHGPERLPPR